MSHTNKNKKTGYVSADALIHLYTQSLFSTDIARRLSKGEFLNIKRTTVTTLLTLLFGSGIH